MFSSRMNKRTTDLLTCFRFETLEILKRFFTFFEIQSELLCIRDRFGKSLHRESRGKIFNHKGIVTLKVATEVKRRSFKVTLMLGPPLNG